MEEKKKNIGPTIQSKPTLAQQRERDEELVTGRFSFTECPGGTLNFSYKKYKHEKIKRFSLKDGEVYQLPRGVAKHLATAGRYTVHKNALDEFGRPSIKLGTIKKRYNFESLEFFDESDLPSNLYTVEKNLAI